MVRRYLHTAKLIGAGLVVCTTVPVAVRFMFRYGGGIIDRTVQFTEEPGQYLKRAMTNLQSLQERMNPTLSETNHR